jgi:hypothetical protein
LAAGGWGAAAGLVRGVAQGLAGEGKGWVGGGWAAAMEGGRGEGKEGETAGAYEVRQERIVHGWVGWGGGAGGGARDMDKAWSIPER